MNQYTLLGVLGSGNGFTIQAPDDPFPRTYPKGQYFVTPNADGTVTVASAGQPGNTLMFNQDPTTFALATATGTPLTQETMYNWLITNLF